MRNAIMGWKFSEIILLLIFMDLSIEISLKTCMLIWWKLKELFWEKAKANANAKPYIFNFIIFHPIVFDDEKLNCTWLHTQNPRRRFFYVLCHSILLVLHFRVNRTFVNLEKTGVKILKVYVRKSNLILHMQSYVIKSAP